MEPIAFFEGPYRFLSNFYRYPVTYEGLTYPTAEAAFQAQKCPQEADRRKYTLVENPVRAKQMGRREPGLPPDWDARSREIMAGILRAKFSDPALRQMLLATGDAPLVEGNRWHDNLWGQCVCPRCQAKAGENRLGKLLMALRASLRQQEAGSEAVLDRIFRKMVAFDRGDPGRIQHFLKVHAFAAQIGRGEGLDPKTQFLLEAAAYVHDIGVRPALAQYGDCAGPHQEALGMAPARALLEECGVPAEERERIVYLVGHHHTYRAIDGPDFQALVEADLLVNGYEEHWSLPAIRHARDTLFQTATGKALCGEMFGL